MPEPVVFQHYQVLRHDDGTLWELGRGAMGVTYKAFDTNLRCPVALKVINAQHLDSEMARQRFLREARAAAALSHPNVASVFHLGESNGDYFYAMEFINGETLEAFVRRRGPLLPLLALRITLQVTRALSAAARQGLVHRDIKPANLMLLRDDEHGEVTDQDDEIHLKVIDFGLAKAAQKDSAVSTITIAGFVGTPHFASPEQLEEREIDARSDFYSLGVTLWYMLAGRPPFGGTIAKIMSQHLTSAPPFETLSALPEPVVRLLDHLLCKDPDDRPQTGADLRREIEAAIRETEDAPSDLHSPTMAEPAPLIPARVASAKYSAASSATAVTATPPSSTRVSPAPVRGPAPAAVPVGAPRGSGSFPLAALAIGLLLLLFLGGVGTAGYLIVQRLTPVKLIATPPPSTPAPTASPEIAATPLPTPTLTPGAMPEPTVAIAVSATPPPTPEPTPDRALRYQQILAGVERRAAAGDTAGAVDGYVQLLQDYQEIAGTRERLERLVADLRARPATSAPTPTAELLASLRRAAAQGSAASMLYLGDRAAPDDPSEAMEWYRQAADQGRPEAMFELAKLYLGGPAANPTEAVRWLRLASDKGSAPAKTYLAQFYQDGESGLPRDYGRMFTLLQQANTLQPNQPATVENLAAAYEHGWGVKADPGLAFVLMKQAADLGSDLALGHLGVFYLKGIGTKEDAAAAVALFQRGADANNAECLCFYAQCLNNGVGGLKTDHAAAAIDYRRAAELGNAQARQWCQQHRMQFAPKH